MTHTYTPKRRKTIFNMAATKIAILVTKLCLHMILHPWYKFLVNRPNWPRYIADYRFWIWLPIAILNHAKLRLFINWPFSEWKLTSAYQISSKSNDWRLRYDDKTISEMAAFRHFEYSKIAVLITWPVFACTSAVQISHKLAKMSPTYYSRSKLNFQYCKWPPI